jgi:predicted 2-oxoglutarate/Fe(II)-dependent dioxygenase YbiX
MNTEPFIVELEDVLSKDFCRHLITKFENSKQEHTPGHTREGINLNIKKGTDLWMANFKENWQKELLKFNKIVHDVLQSYNDHVGNETGISFHTLFTGSKVLYPQIQKTGENEYYNWHSDGEPSKNTRVLTLLFYLNDVDEKQGGATEFIHGKRLVQPKTGKVVIFPATWSYMHRGQAVKYGEKYVIAMFVYEPSLTIIRPEMLPFSVQ